MENVPEKTKRKDGSESFCCESVNETTLSPSSVGNSCSDNGSSSLLGWPIRKAQITDKCSKNDASEGKVNPHMNVKGGGDSLLKKQSLKFSEVEMMKERFAKLLLGEDMSGSGKGVCPALAISNAITNLCATIFGQLWRLEPMPSEKKAMWKREMEWLLCVADHIVEMIPSWQTFPDGKRHEVMTCRPRADLFVNLPALRKLDNLLFEILGSFTGTEFWYVDQGLVAPEVNGSVSFQKTIQRQEEKWWLPVPRVPPAGLPEESRKVLSNKRECASQVLKAALSINSIALAEMEVPDSYLESLPKNGRACLGDVIYRYITSEHFSSECLLDCLDLSSEHNASEIANRVEASIYVWRRRPHSKPTSHPNRSSAKSSWEMVKDLMTDADKRELLAERAETLLLCLKQRFPGLTQTTLDSTKIQFNKDVGKSILESYSRVLESLAFNIVARIDDLLYVDDLTKQSDKLSVITHRKVWMNPSYTVPVSGTTPQNRTTLSTPRLSPGGLPLISPARGERTPFLNIMNMNSRPPRMGGGVKRVLTNYLGGDAKVKSTEGLGSVSSRIGEGALNSSRLSVEKKEASSRSEQMDR